MQRNLYRRVEVGFPIKDPSLKMKVIQEGLRVYLEGTAGAWVMGADSKYVPTQSPNFALTDQETDGNTVTFKDLVTEMSSVDLEMSEDLEGDIEALPQPTLSLGLEGQQLEAQLWLLTKRQDISMI